MLTLHILLKDLRRHRWEIAIYLVSILGWAAQEAHPNQWLKNNASALFPVLMFVVWFLLIIRVVQGESLIGTREFWTTRPYRAGQLAAAKLAFLVLCLHVPFFLAQCWLLTQAGFALTGLALLQLFLLQLEFFFILTLPAAALAAITASIVQWVLAIIGGVLVGVVISWFPWNLLTPALEGTELLSITIGFIVIAALLIVLFLWQYNRRGTLAARVLFGAAGLAVPLCIVLASTSLARSVSYSTGPSDIPIRLALSSKPERQYSRTEYDPRTPQLEFPVEGSTTSQDLVTVIEGMRLHFSASDNWSSESPWTKESITLSSEPDSHSLSAFVPAGVADKIAAEHADVGAEFALAVYRLDPPQHVDTSAAHFDLPGIGTCNWGESAASVLFHNHDCTAPLHLPDVYVLDTESAENTCASNRRESPLPPGHHAQAINVAMIDLPVEFDPSPLRTISLDPLGFWQPVIHVESRSDDPEHEHDLRASICRGTPFSLRTGRFQQRMRVTIPLGNLGKENRTTMQLMFQPLVH